jgi:hypothetical protein
MYIVKHVPSGKYLRKVKNPNYYAQSFWPDRGGWRSSNHFLTDNLSKARVYGNLGHIKNSLGEYPDNHIDPSKWEVIELNVSIKEK